MRALGRETQVAVKNNGLGTLSLDKTDRQLGVIGKQRVDANDNGIAGGPNTMGQNHRLIAAQQELLTIPGGDAAVHTLGI